jgi:hypothetical protein
MPQQQQQQAAPTYDTNFYCQHLFTLFISEYSLCCCFLHQQFVVRERERERDRLKSSAGFLTVINLDLISLQGF